MLEQISQLAREAGDAIMQVYNGSVPTDVSHKADDSPVTAADLAAHDVIVSGLKQLTPDIPVLSEEDPPGWEVRQHWQRYWLVDPLDGTKEFIKKNGEFTVNIALIKNNKPVLGVVYVPVTGVLYYGADGTGSFVVTIKEEVTAANVEDILKTAAALPAADKPSVYTVVASRSHNTPETEAFIDEKRKEYGEVDMISSGSSIKLCLVAEGKAQVYPRLAPTMEWDTAAGHGVAKFAGCSVYNYETKQEVVYNKENLLNPWFVVERSN